MLRVRVIVCVVVLLFSQPLCEPLSEVPFVCQAYRQVFCFCYKIVAR